MVSCQGFCSNLAINFYILRSKIKYIFNMFVKYKSNTAYNEIQRSFSTQTVKVCETYFLLTKHV